MKPLSHYDFQRKVVLAKLDPETYGVQKTIARGTRKKEPKKISVRAEKEAEAHEIFLEFWNSEAGSKARLDNNFKVFNNIQKNSPEAIWSEIVAGMQNGEVVEQPFWSSLKSWFGSQPSTAAVVEGKQHEEQPEEITDVSSCDEIV